MAELWGHSLDPLSINWRRQLSALLFTLPNTSVYHTSLNALLAEDPRTVLATLSRLLAEPPLTVLVAEYFTPVLIDLVARWLTDNQDRSSIIKQLWAFGLLIEAHQELVFILMEFLRKPELTDGPLAFLTNFFEEKETTSHLLEYTLLAYFRILNAGREIIADVSWDLTYLSDIIWASQHLNGVRWLAIRCYAWQNNMPELERENLEINFFGEIGKEDCPVHCGENFHGEIEVVDGWMLLVQEANRVRKMRSSIEENQQDYFYLSDEGSGASLQTSDLSPWTANIFGILLYRKPVVHQPQKSPFVATPSAVVCLRQLAAHLSMQLPLVISSPPSSGKTTLLQYLASLLFPEQASNQIVTINLADTSLDPRSLLGSYVSSTTRSGAFEWNDGVLVRAMLEGKWLLFKDIDRGSPEVLGLLSPVVGSLSGTKEVGSRAFIDIPMRGLVRAAPSFALFATMSSEVDNVNPNKCSFLNSHKWSHVRMSSLTVEDISMIVETHFPILSGPIRSCLVAIWQALSTLPGGSSGRQIGLRDLLKFCARVASLLPVSPVLECATHSGAQSLADIIRNPALIEDIYLEARDTFFGSVSATDLAHSRLNDVATTIANHLGLSSDRQTWLLQKPLEFHIGRDADGCTTSIIAGRTRLLANKARIKDISEPSRGFALHGPAIQLLTRIATCISLTEPILLSGETGTGKTSLITHIASLLNKPLISLNLSMQTESSDLIGGFRPVDVHLPASELQSRFDTLFLKTFSRKKNINYEKGIQRAISTASWKRLVKLWSEAGRLAQKKLSESEGQLEDSNLYPPDLLDSTTPRKRRKTLHLTSDNSMEEWDRFLEDVRQFEIQYVEAKGKFSFAFVEGPLVRALRSGTWVLLDEINLASAETLESILCILQSPTSSVTLVERGSLEPVYRHPDFRLFACMNPATDVGKRDLPLRLRCCFTEIFVPPPDTDKGTLMSVISHYIGRYAEHDKPVIDDVADFYIEARRLAETGRVADGSHKQPHYSMRTLSRTLTFAADSIQSFTLRRGLWEGCLMTFIMPLERDSAQIMSDAAELYILKGAATDSKNLQHHKPNPSQQHSAEPMTQIGPFRLLVGPIDIDAAEGYILTPSVEKKIVDLSRIVSAQRFPILIEGPTSSGKTSAVEFLALRTGHRFVRINNHEHTDIQEYLGSYVSDPDTGTLAYKDGLLVRALRDGDWIVLDELNLAPTDVLEALNRLLDDNRELLIPETQEVVKPHPHFRLFATQNPPGIYAGRKVLSRAFRNRFIEIFFDDIPQDELEIIICQRCRIAPSHGKRIIEVFRELQARRQAGRVFEGKHGFATLRDLFRWANRGATSYQELAETGYMLLAERARRDDDTKVVKEIIEKVMKVEIDIDALYTFKRLSELEDTLGCRISDSSNIIWTKSMRRLYILLCCALQHQEPVLLVGETGCGKTSVCQIYADNMKKRLVSVNGHQNTEAADLIGSQRPNRSNTSIDNSVINEAKMILSKEGIMTDECNLAQLKQAVIKLRHASAANLDNPILLELEKSLTSLGSLFKWHDGPLVSCMRSGDIFLLDEISLVDDSVLERMNSVLEPSRSILLAERGGESPGESNITASQDFKFIATMNPGGDYGKKELSPALRNRFTEIWVPAINERSDLEQIIASSWNHDALRSHTVPLLDFIDWLKNETDDTSIVSLRDILAWVQFSNSCFECMNTIPRSIFEHAAFMTVLDGLASFPQLSSWSDASIKSLRERALSHLRGLIPREQVDAILNRSGLGMTDDMFYIDIFGLRKGPNTVTEANGLSFNLKVPTTLDNAVRIMRACQLKKPILLEGSPGVGKTSLINALSVATGYELHRINFSDQTDLVDLFGADLPVEGGQPGQFAWRDAIFLRALQEGRWVLLDEMNLASQSVLEGLNSVLDHRGSVYIPELSRTYHCHPNFRIFAAQNPLHQGGGRKGLPKSFLNRFTKVYIEAMKESDAFIACSYMFPTMDENLLQLMIKFNYTLNAELNGQTFGQIGAPWEVNLRDLIRWVSLVAGKQGSDPEEFLFVVYGARFRTWHDRESVYNIYKSVFSQSGFGAEFAERSPWFSVSSSHVQFGKALIARHNSKIPRTLSCPLPCQLKILEAALTSVAQNWLVIATGPAHSGKSRLIKTMAEYSEQTLKEFTFNSGSESTDLIGSFEQVNLQYRVKTILQEAVESAEFQLSRSSSANTSDFIRQYQKLLKFLNQACLRQSVDLFSVKEVLDKASNSLNSSNLSSISDLRSSLTVVMEEFEPFRFEWIDGPLIQALQNGYWLLLNDVNLCSPSVLDRLNSLCETNGVLVVSEKSGKLATITPHPNFRLFMTADTANGELSRAMRNRGVELSLLEFPDDWSTDWWNDVLHESSTYVTDARASANVLMHSELQRRGYNRFSFQISPSNATGFQGMTQSRDSLSGLLFRYLCLLSATDGHCDVALATFIAQLWLPDYPYHITRFLRSNSPSDDKHAKDRMLYIISRMQDFANMPFIHDMRSKYIELSGLRLGCQNLNVLLNSALHDSRQLRNSLDRQLLRQVLDVLARLSAIEFDLANNEQHGDFIVSPPLNGQILQKVMSFLVSISGMIKFMLLSPSMPNDVKQTAFNLLLELLKYLPMVKDKLASRPQDISALYWLSQQIRRLFENAPETFLEMRRLAQDLFDNVNLESGYGFFDIWSAFARFSNSSVEVSKLHTLREARSTAVPDYEFCFRLWVEIIQDGIREDKKIILADVYNNGNPDQHKDASLHFYLPSALNGLSITCLEISHFFDCGKAGDNGYMWQMDKIAEAAYLQPVSCLIRQLCYKAAATKPQGPIGLIRANVNWLEALWVWEDSGNKILRGSSNILLPWHLLSTAAISRGEGDSLQCYEAYKAELDINISLCLLDMMRGSDRHYEIVHLLVQNALLLCACFPAFFKGDTKPLVHNSLGDNSIHGVQESLLALKTHIGSCGHKQLAPALRTELLPTVERMIQSNNVGSISMADVGHGFMALSHISMMMYVPELALDPLRVHACQLDILGQFMSQLNRQIQLFAMLERATTGNGSNLTIADLQKELYGYQMQLKETPAYALRELSAADIPQLRSFWDELRSFMDHILSREKLSSLILAMDEDANDVSDRERVIQDSISIFMQRIDVAYPVFRDLWEPFKLALLQCRFGLRLVLHSSTPKISPETICFPNIRAAIRCMSDFIPSNDILSSTRNLIFHLVGTAFASMCTHDEHLPLTKIILIYKELHIAHLQREHLLAKKQESTQSLYRFQAHTQSFEETDTQQEDYLRGFFTGVGDAKQPTKDVVHNRDSQYDDILLSLHLSLFGENDQAESGIERLWRDMTMDHIFITLDNDFEKLSADWDRSSISYRLDLLNNTISAMKGPKESYRFHRDPNIPEMGKAAMILRSLQSTLSEFKVIWAEKILLHQLAERCERFLAMSMRTNLSIALPIIENITIQLEDWELESSDGFSLREYQKSLILLIFEWRKMEADSWKSLLEEQTEALSSNSSKWWFLLYDMTVDGLENVQKESADMIEGYLDNMASLLDGFILTSPLGQYSSRLALLGAFSVYLSRLASVKTKSSTVLVRAAGIMASVKKGYAQFALGVDSYLKERTEEIHQALELHAKTLEWRDVNIHALKERVRRSHAEILKYVRKYRELLRQPINSLITVGALTALEVQESSHGGSCVASKDHLNQLHAQYGSYDFPTLNQYENDRSPFANLKTTYLKFNSLLASELRALTNYSAANHIEDLSTSIFNTVEHLSKATFSNVDSDNTRKFLLMRKRKVWGNFLKEFRRIGISAYVKQNVLLNQRNQRWILEQPQIEHHQMVSRDIAKSEAYFDRVISTLLQLRSTDSHRHSDIPKREMQRCVMYLESALSMALSARRRLSSLLRYEITIHNITDRLHTLLLRGDGAVFGNVIPRVLSSHSALISSLMYSLKHIASSVQDRLDLSSDATNKSNLRDYLTRLEDFILRSNEVLTDLKQLSRSVESTVLPFLLRDEILSLGRARDHVDQALLFLCSNSPMKDMKDLSDPVFNWLVALRAELPPLITTNKSTESAEIISVTNDFLKTLLGIWEVLSAKYKSNTLQKNDADDNYVQTYSMELEGITRALKLELVSDYLNKMQLCFTHHSQSRTAVRMILPFLDNYLLLVQWHRISCSQWNKSLWKLLRVLSAVLLRVGTDGFCQPDESGKSDLGENLGDSDGVGFGKGTGMNDITDEIHDPSQVEGLKDVSEDNDRVEHEDFDNALELEHGLDTAEPDLVGDEDELDEMDIGDENGKHSSKDSGPPGINEEFWNQIDQVDQGNDNDELMDESKRHEVQDEATELTESPNITDDGDNIDSNIPEQKELNSAEVDGNDDSTRLDSPETVDQRLDDSDVRPQEEEVLHDLDCSDPGDIEPDVFDRHSPSPKTEDVLLDNAENDEQTMEYSENNPDSEKSESDSSQRIDSAKSPDGGHSEGHTNGKGQGNGAFTDSRRSAPKRDHLQPLKETAKESSGFEQSNADVDMNEEVSVPEDFANEDSSIDQFGALSGHDAANALNTNIVEYSDQMTDITHMQALGPATGNRQATKLDDMEVSMHPNGNENEHLAGNPLSESMEPLIDHNITPVYPEANPSSARGEEDGSSNVEQSNLTHMQVSHAYTPSHLRRDIYASEASVDKNASADAVEGRIEQWHSLGNSVEYTDKIWRLYRNATETLSNELCEQLRLILEPTMATRLKGDYRTGKRLNMKKIIPYIASDYQKDKIWLRRTRPSQREYQVVIALDDSRSMADSHSVHLAFQTLALVTTALSRLEVGSIAIAKFGGSVDIVREFSEISFSDDDGSKIIDAFRFDQDSTDILSLLENSINFLSDARNARAMQSTSATELWQLEIIISDGICQDHDALRAKLIKAKESRILIVFIIIDSLQHSSADPSAKVSQSKLAYSHSSIMDMSQVQYKLINGKMEMEIRRYLDTFPFEFFVILRDVDTLPDILSGILKQFFERISGA